MLIFLQMYPGPPGLEVTPHWEPCNEEETGQVWLNFLLQTPRRAPLFSLAALRALAGPGYVNIMDRLWSHPPEATF